MAQERRIALIGGKRGAEDVDAPAEEPARAPAGSRALFEPKLKSVPAPAGSRALFEPKLRPVRRKHAMSGLLGNEGPRRPRSLSPSKKARKRERERYAQQPSTGVQVKDAPAPEIEDPLAGFEDVPEPDELAGFEDVPPGGFPGEKAAALPATKPAGAKQQPAATVTPARVLEIDEPPVDDRPAELSSVLRAAKRKARDERRAAIQPAIIMPDIPGMRGSEADATPAQVLEPGKRAAEEVQDESAKVHVEEDPFAAGMPVGREYFGRETEAEAAHPGRVKMWGVQAKEPRMRTGPGGKAGYHDISAGGTRVHGYMPTATRPDPFMTQDYSGSWQPTGSEDAAKWSEHAMKNESMRQKAAQANMQAAMPAQAVEEDMPQAPPMSEPFHFQGAGSDHGNIDLSGLKFNMGANKRPEAAAFMDAVNAGVGHMPAHEAEILTNNAAQASQHVGAMPASNFHQGLMGDFSSLMEALPSAAPPLPAMPYTEAIPSVQPEVAPEIADLPTVPHQEAMPQVGTGADYIAETQGDKRPAEDVIPGSFKHEIDDPATEQLAPFPVYTPPEVEAPPMPDKIELPATPEPEVVAEPNRTLQSNEASSAAPHPAEPSRKLEPSRKSVSFRVPKPKPVQAPEPQKPYRRIVADYGRPAAPVGTQSVNVSAPATASAPVSSGQASGQASSAGAGAALREIAKAVAGKAKPKARKSGISGARKRYTDARKTKLAALRAHRDKLVREHKSKTKKMPKKERDAARREFRKKVDGQYKEQVKKYPPARGMKDVGAVLKLIKRVQSARFS